MMLNNKIEYFPEAAMFHGHIPFIMGTKLDLIAMDARKVTLGKVWDWLCFEADHLDGMLNRFVFESEVSRINKSNVLQNVSISHELWTMINEAKRYWTLTDGLFDVTRGGMQELTTDLEDKVSLKGHELDFGGFAKGFLLKELKSKLVSSGIQTAFVDFGDSSIMALGHHPFGDCWKVGVKDPFGGAVLGEIELRDQAMSTSGNTPVYSSHIVNPKTGEADNSSTVVTVVSDDPLDAEVLSTVAVIASPEELEIIKQNFPGTMFSIFRK
ncbi:MAG: FAD:protein FMN transferase [Bacteroidales bacterium]|nr:FAD:protein FMN transferase [Bacteroidales bacterium]MDY6002487.1 FAD:protein FMN transferase [Candidatus Cryptobacteroides sp.]